MLSPKFARNALVWHPVGSTFSFDWILSIVLQCWWPWRHFYICDICSVSVFNNSVHPQSAADYGYYAFVEFTHFVYCLIQKIKRSVVLPSMEQWEEYMAHNHSKFAAIEKDWFLAGTRVLSVLETVGSSYLNKDFRRDCRKFLEDFVNCVLSTVAAKSIIGQWLSCSALLFWLVPTIMPPCNYLTCCLMDFKRKAGRGAQRWRPASRSISRLRKSRGSWSNRTSTRSRPDVGNVLTFCFSQAGFHVRRHLYKPCIVSKHVGYSLAVTFCSLMFRYRSFNKQHLLFVDH